MEEQQETIEHDESKRIPLTQTIGYGAGTFLAAGIFDLAAHLGPTGLVVGGIAAYVASQHGPELIERVHEAMPARPMRHETSTAVTKRGKSGRSFLDRALGRFPVLEVEVEEGTAYDADVSDDDYTMPELTPRIVHPIQLARDVTLEADEIVGAGINIFGVKGSGKTGIAARLAEQFAQYRVAEVIFDIKGDFGSLVTERRVTNGYAGYHGHAPRGRSVLANQAQVVYDLRTWQTPEAMASLMCAVVEELLETVSLAPEGDLFPCLVFLDEAQYWLPQTQPSYLSQHTYKRLLDAFNVLAAMGRSRGLTPIIATQRIAKVNKDIIAQAEMNILMKATLDIDLQRYHEYFNKSLADDEQIRGFAAGEAIVCLPDGKQLLTRFLERQSRHMSHTPTVTQALRRFQERGRGAIEMDDAPEAQQERDTEPRMPVEARDAEPEPLQLHRVSRVDLQKNKVLMLALQYIQAGADGPRPLAREMGVSPATAKGYIDQLRAMGEIA